MLKPIYVTFVTGLVLMPPLVRADQNAVMIAATAGASSQDSKTRIETGSQLVGFQSGEGEGFAQGMVDASIGLSPTDSSLGIRIDADGSVSPLATSVADGVDVFWAQDHRVRINADSKDGVRGDAGLTQQIGLKFNVGDVAILTGPLYAVLSVQCFGGGWKASVLGGNEGSRVRIRMNAEADLCVALNEDAGELPTGNQLHADAQLETGRFFASAGITDRTYSSVTPLMTERGLGTHNVQANGKVGIAF